MLRTYAANRQLAGDDASDVFDLFHAIDNVDRFALHVCVGLMTFGIWHLRITPKLGLLFIRML